MTSFLIALSLMFTSCGSGQKKAEGQGDEAYSSANMAGDEEFEVNGDSDSNKAGGLSTVYFDFNSSGLREDTKSTLEGNVKFLKDHADVKVQVEGHCDERGGVQYNLALGERRAKAVKSYLVAMGISSKRISTISFGKERPVSFGHDESSWSQNRRGNFVITAK